MALKLNERYPQRWDSPSNDYPQGAFKNLTELGEQDGSYLEQDWLNDYSGFFGALLRNAEMTPNGLVDTAQQSQFYDALMQLIDAELTTKFDKSDLVNTSGQSTDKVMSQKAVTDFVSDAVPVGVVKAYIGETAPNDKWLLCRGQAFSAESYPDLTQLLPDLKIPDLRGVALRGLDANRGFDPDRTLLSYQEDAMQTFDGSFYMRATAAGSGTITDTQGSFSSVASATEAQSLQHTSDYHKLTRIDFKPNARTSHETVMKNVAVNFIIKAR